MSTVSDSCLVVSRQSASETAEMGEHDVAVRVSCPDTSTHTCVTLFDLFDALQVHQIIKLVFFQRIIIDLIHNYHCNFQ